MHSCYHSKKVTAPTPVLLPGKSHVRNNLVGCSSWGHEESDTTERLHFHFSLSCIGEGNGSPHQCSCLENLRDGGAWWAAICGVAQSQTQLKRISRSSTISSMLSFNLLWWLKSLIQLYIFEAHSFYCVGGGGNGVLIAQSCPILCNSIDCSPPGSSVCGIF